ncbi:MAG: hypothetical protein J6B95_08210 [Oscillospiraceae bacterium]|nr:hypothetical protein [Oscillospiraceae bacterium]
MTYIDIAYYSDLYGAIDPSDFKRLSFDACRKVDNYTTGVDGVRKLSVAFPTDEYAAESVRRCVAKVLNLMHQIEQAEKYAASLNGYVETESGLRGKVISSVSAGNESISYAVNHQTATEIDKAVSDPAARERLFARTIAEYLSGYADANGVNLMHMGPYKPRRYTC